jgi:hypothetical protein
MAKPSKRDQLVEATKDLLWQVGSDLRFVAGVPIQLVGVLLLTEESYGYSASTTAGEILDNPTAGEASAR